MKKLNEIFDTYSGNDLVLSYLNQDDDGIAFVSRTEKNNGITSYVKKLKI